MDDSCPDSYGKSQFDSMAALYPLWFILAIATLYVTALGVEVVETGKRRWVDPHWFRGNSYFRIGWEWVQAAVLNGWRLRCRVRFRGNRERSPVMASLKQHFQRSERLEFTVQTYQYATA